MDGQSWEPVALIEHLNSFAGALGVGRGYHLGDTVLGIKGRVAFEAPAAELILRAHRELEKLVLTEEQRFQKDSLGDLYGRHLHRGAIHEPFLRDLEALFASSQERVTGRVRLRLENAHAEVQGIESPFSMLAASTARYGERAADDALAAAPRALALAMAEPARLFLRAGKPHPPVESTRETKP